MLTRRSFAAGALASAAPKAVPVVDSHMHVWSADPSRFPFAHPYEPHFKPPATAASVETLLDEMQRHGVSHCVLVQVIYYGWDNTYVADCLRRYPQKFRGQGLIDPTAPDAADRLEFWMRRHKFSGMRFSPIYYRDSRGGDGWLDGPAHDALWVRAEKLRAIFNFFISTQQLPRLETRIRRHPGVRVVIDHLARIDLAQPDPLPEFRKLLALARYPNVWCKVSELNLLSPSKKYPYSDTFPWVHRLYDAFGPERLLWGTGFPGAARAQAGRPSLVSELALIRDHIEFFTAGDREKVLGRNAARLWGFKAD